jgi:hypothetical protein
LKPKTTYNKADPPEAYTNPTVQPRLVLYTMMTREVHGLEFDPKRSLLDLEVITRIGEGK